MYELTLVCWVTLLAHARLRGLSLQRRALLVRRNTPGFFDDIMTVDDVPFLANAAKYAH